VATTASLPSPEGSTKARRHPWAKTTEQFIEEARRRHNGKYDYSFAVYRNAKTKLRIWCPLHGEYDQLPDDHLRGRGCPQCRHVNSARKRTIPFSAVIERFRRTHGDRYDYGQADFVNQSTKIMIICPEHGPFRQRPYVHSSGQGCPRCRYLKSAAAQRLSLQAILSRFRRAHGDRFDYRYVREVANCSRKVRIVCPDHGEFLQSIAGHASGKGCPACCESRGERRVAKTLKQMRLAFERQKRFPSCRDRKPLPFDFYVPTERTLIEFDGSQHHEESPRFDLSAIRRRDRIKTAWAEENGFPLIRLPFDCFDAIPEILFASLASNPQPETKQWRPQGP